MKARSLASRISAVLLLLAPCTGQAQGGARVWEAGQRAISTLANADSATVVGIGTDLKGGSPAYGQLLWASYLHEFGHPDRALAVCNALDPNRLSDDEAFWHAYTSINYWAHNMKYGEAYNTGKRMLKLAEELDCPECLAAAQLEWGIQLKEDFEITPALEMGLKGKRGATALERDFFKHHLLSRSVSLINDRDTIQTVDLLLRPALEYFTEENMPLHAAKVAINLAQNEAFHYNSESAYAFSHIYGVLLFYEDKPALFPASIDSLDRAFACMDNKVNPGRACQNRICRAQLEYYTINDGGLKAVPYFEEALSYAEQARDPNSFYSATDFLIYIWADSDDPERARVRGVDLPDAPAGVPRRLHRLPAHAARALRVCERRRGPAPRRRRGRRVPRGQPRNGDGLPGRRRDRARR